VTRDRWALELEARAGEHWTEARTDALLRGKDVAVRPRDAAVLLRALGILNADASMPAATTRKYFQINHMVGTLGRAVDELRARHAIVRIVDAGCGRSYLTMLLAWCGAHRWDQRVEVLGVDRNPDVIAEGQRRAILAGLDDRVRFEARAVDELARDRDALGEVHAVIGLHACDTASCDAIALGVAAGAELIAVAPCCQAELARGWATLAPTDDGFAPVWSTPHLRRELAAHTTDLMRTLLLRAAGYAVTAMEFIPDEHTRKNTLLRAQRNRPAARDADAARAYAALVRTTGGIGLALAARLGGTIAS